MVFGLVRENNNSGKADIPQETGLGGRGGEHGPWYWKRVEGADCPASIYLGFRSDEK